MLKDKDKYLFGVCKAGEKGQIVIPKDARDIYGISSGDSLIVVGNKEGIALLKAEVFVDFAETKMNGEN